MADDRPDNVQEPEANAPVEGTIDRRTAMKMGALGAFFAAGTAAALTPLRHLDNDASLDALMQQQYERLTPERMEEILHRIEGEIKERHGVSANVQDIKPMDGVEFAYALNISRCVGCRRCVHACAEENNTSRDPEIQYIRVLEMPKNTQSVEASDHYYDHDEVPANDRYYMPVQCQQCDNPPCVKACPVRATWKEPDGIVVIDYNWCIGCRYCQAACPYWARRFNFSEPQIPADEINTDMAYLGNRIRPRGVMEKCTFCLRRTRQGLYPACAEACPAGARQFGNLLDPDSEINHILHGERDRPIYILKEDAGTVPRFYYWFDK